jgi:hypothetical protein
MLFNKGTPTFWDNFRAMFYFSVTLVQVWRERVRSLFVERWQVRQQDISHPGSATYQWAQDSCSKHSVPASNIHSG